MRISSQACDCAGAGFTRPGPEARGSTAHRAAYAQREALGATRRSRHTARIQRDLGARLQRGERQQAAMPGKHPDGRLERPALASATRPSPAGRITAARATGNSPAKQSEPRPNMRPSTYTAENRLGGNTRPIPRPRARRRGSSADAPAYQAPGIRTLPRRDSLSAAGPGSALTRSPDARFRPHREPDLRRPCLHERSQPVASSAGTAIARK